MKAYVPEPKLPMDYEPRKISLEGEGRKMPSFTVGKQHLDSNHHVNNGQYIYMAQDYLPEGFSGRCVRNTESPRCSMTVLCLRCLNRRIR